tara:strand:- start:517 stop:1413 length:897 start_codon:yes stop_codon:yes gene_type:complete
MQRFLMVFYVIFFSTGFMGGAALFLLKLRIRSRLLGPLLLFQGLFLMGTGLILVYLSGVERSLLVAVVAMSTNIAIWLVVIVLVRRTAPTTRVGWNAPTLAQVGAVLVIVKTVANVMVAATGRSPLGEAAWLLATHSLVALGMASFGVVLRGPITPREPAALRPLLRAYGTLAIVLAPLGFVEFGLQSAGIPWLEDVSLDHVLYMAWNVVSMTAAIDVFRPSGSRSSILEAVPEERIRQLGLSAREVEVAILIGQGLTNKEIAARLFISPATVRTHVYNLYQKVGAGSRVELLNMLHQ